MSKSTSGKSHKVLGIFEDEAALRNHLASNLDLIEPDLTLLDMEYALPNPGGAGGRIDILARDKYRHIVCIEIKRSDGSARSTLNELSKYVSLLVSHDRVSQQNIRCIVVSTHWNELLLPLSYFAKSNNVGVSGLRALREADRLILTPVPLVEFRYLPQLNSDMDLIYFDKTEPRERAVEILKFRTGRLPFMRLALLMFDPRQDVIEGPTDHPMVICVWRVHDGFHEDIESVIERPIGTNAPYAAPGWEPESDVLEWIGHIPRQDLPEYSMGWTQGSPEKLSNLCQYYDLAKVERLGSWAQGNLVNDDATILEAALATSPMTGSGRSNRHIFRQKVTPAHEPSWRMTVQSFLEFIQFEPAWQEEAKSYLDQLGGDDEVEIRAYDFRHLIYAIHQAQLHENTTLGYFEIIIWRNNAAIKGLLGTYAWNGVVCPASAVETINSIYGSIMQARLAIGSAVDEARYETAHALHGFYPVLDYYQDATVVSRMDPLARYSLLDFVAANIHYSEAISTALEQVGRLPR